MTVHLTPEQEQRIEAIIHSDHTIDDVVETALTAVEQRAAPRFAGTGEEQEALLLTGMNSPDIAQEEFWASVDEATDAMLAEHKISGH